MQKLRLDTAIGNHPTFAAAWPFSRARSSRGNYAILLVRACGGQTREWDVPAQTTASQRSSHERSRQSTLKDFTGAISRLGRQQLWWQALALLDDMYLWQALALLDDMYLLHQLEPDLRAFCAAISACSKGAQWQKALQLLELAHDSQVVLNEFAFSSAISACGKSGRWECAITLLELMEFRKANTNIVVCNSAISACEKGHQWRQALCLLACAAERNLALDLVSFNSAISACEKGHRWTSALGLFTEMRQVLLSPNVITFNACISACGKAEYWSYALALLSEMGHTESKNLPNAISYSAAMNACVRGEEWERALVLFTDMIELKMETNEVVYNAAIGAYSKGRMWQEAVGLLEELQSPDVISFSVVISALQGANWELALCMFDRMQQIGITPNVVTFSALLGVLENAHLWERCLRLLGEMRERLVEPNDISYTLAISACEKGQQFASALQLLTDMQKQKLQPNLVAWKAVLRQQPWDIALSLFQDLQKSGLELDVQTYNHVFNACQKHQAWEETLLVLESMQENNVKPQGSTLQILSCIPDLHRQAPFVLMQLLQDDSSYALAAHPGQLMPQGASLNGMASSISTPYGASAPDSSKNRDANLTHLRPPSPQHEASRSRHSAAPPPPGPPPPIRQSTSEHSVEQPRSRKPVPPPPPNSSFHHSSRFPQSPPPLPASKDSNHRIGAIPSSPTVAALPSMQSPPKTPLQSLHAEMENASPSISPPSQNFDSLPRENQSKNAETEDCDDDAGDRPMSYRLLPGGDAIIDLHGLPVEVARIAVQVALEDLLISPANEFVASRGGRGGNFIIVTGRGKHSPGGEPLLRPAVLSLLRDEFGIAARLDHSESGRVRIPGSELWRLRGVPAPSPGR